MIEGLLKIEMLSVLVKLFVLLKYFSLLPLQFPFIKIGCQKKKNLVCQVLFLPSFAFLGGWVRKPHKVSAFDVCVGVV